MASSYAAIFAFSLAISYVAANVCLTSHNKLRALHVGTDPLVWDTSLASSAQLWAQHLVQLGSMKHSYVQGEGENIYYSKSKHVGACADAALAWYNEIKDYNYNSPGFSGATGHFTQLVWKSSKKVGVGIATSAPDANGYKTTYIVAKYTPQGNYYTKGYEARDFTNNVAPQKQGAVVPSRYDLDPSLCSDNSGTATCANYKSWNFCETYKSFIASYCAKTCNMC